MRYCIESELPWPADRATALNPAANVTERGNGGVGSMGADEAPTAKPNVEEVEYVKIC